jgi:hypothetical protein
MTKDEQLDYQRKVILEEYNEHLAIQKRELNHGKGTFVRTTHLVSGREQDGEKRAT